MWTKVFTSMHFKQANGDESKKNNECTMLLHIVFLSTHYLYLADERHYFWQPSFFADKVQIPPTEWGLICRAQSSCGIQLDIVGGARRSGFRLLKVILGSQLFQRLKAYSMACLSILARLRIDSNFRHDVCTQNTVLLCKYTAPFRSAETDYITQALLRNRVMSVFSRVNAKQIEQVNFRSWIIVLKVKRRQFCMWQCVSEVWLCVLHNHWLFYPEFSVSVKK